MLQFIREKSQGWFAWTVVTVVCLTFALWGVHAYLYSVQGSEVVAKVNGVKITQDEFQTAYNQLKRQQQLQLGANYTASEASNTMLKQSALQSLITNIILRQALKSEGFRASPELLEMRLAQIPVFQEKGVFSAARFQEVMNNLSYTPDQFLDEIREEIVATQLQYGLITSAFVLPSEVSRSVTLINQRRSFQYMILPLSHFAKGIQITDQMIKDYYTQHTTDFQLPEKVSISYLDLKLSDLMQAIHPTDTQLKDFYQSTISRYTTPKQWQLARILIPLSANATSKDITAAQTQSDEIMTKIKAGEKFNDLVKIYSQDSATVSHNGQMPWLTAEQLDPAVSSVLDQSSLKEGQVLGPIRTTDGYQIIKVLDIRLPKTAAFDAVKTRVADAYKRQQAESKFADLSDQLANLTYEDPHSLNKAATQLHLSLQTTGLFTQQGAAEGIAKNPKIVAAAFGDDVLGQGNNSNPVNISDEEVVILRVNQHVPATMKPLSSVKAGILSTLMREQSIQNANQAMNQLIDKLKNKQSVDALQKQYGLSWQTAESVGRRDKSIDPNILSGAFDMPRISEIPVVGSMTLPSGDLVIVQLLNVTDGGMSYPAEMNAQILNTGMANDNGTLTYQLYTQHLMDTANIKKSKLDSDNDN